MTAFAAYTVIGLGLGGIFSLAALGIVLIYRTTGVLNFAHGAMGMFSTFVAWQVFYGWSHPFWPGWVSPLLAVVAGRGFVPGACAALSCRVGSCGRGGGGAVSWMPGGLVAALAGILITPFITVETTSLTLLIIEALAAALIGGLVSLPLAVLGGFILGLLETYPAIWIQSIGFPRLVALIVIIAVLFVRNPRGFSVAAK